MFKVTDFKLYRLCWLLYGLPYFVLMIYWYFDPEQSSLLEHLSHLVSVMVSLGVVFYAIGARTISRQFWKYFLPFSVIEEHWNLFNDLESTWDDFVIPNLVVSIPFIAIYFYAFKRNEIWGHASNKALNSFPSVTGTVTQRRSAIMPLRHCPLA